MHKLRFSPAARMDIIEIAQYVNNTLKNPIAANDLAVDLINAAETIAEFPYSNPVYIPIKPLKKEYRKLLVKNYIIFYTTNEEAGEVQIARIIYARRNINPLLT